MTEEIESWLILKYGIGKAEKIYEAAMERSLMINPGPVTYYGEHISEDDFRLIVRYFLEQR